MIVQNAVVKFDGMDTINLACPNCGTMLFLEPREQMHQCLCKHFYIVTGTVVYTIKKAT